MPVKESLQGGSMGWGSGGRRDGIPRGRWGLGTSESRMAAGRGPVKGWRVHLVGAWGRRPGRAEKEMRLGESSARF